MGSNAKDLLLAAKARDLLIYTRKKTKPVNSDVDARDVAKLLRRIAAKRQRSLARQAAYRSPDLPPWE